MIEYHSLKIIFSLSHGTAEPHFGHVTIFPINVEVSKDSLSPNTIGEGNTAEHCLHTTNVCAI